MLAMPSVANGWTRTKATNHIFPGNQQDGPSLRVKMCSPSLLKNYLTHSKRENCLCWFIWSKNSLLPGQGFNSDKSNHWTWLLDCAIWSIFNAENILFYVFTYNAPNTSDQNWILALYFVCYIALISKYVIAEC